MTREEEIRELERQEKTIEAEARKRRAEIQEKIRELKDNSVISGRAKLNFSEGGGARKPEWYVAILCNDFQGRHRWTKIIREGTRAGATKKIEEIKGELTRLQEKLLEGDAR
jgi:DNA-binding transcriptional MerR regulator